MNYAEQIGFLERILKKYRVPLYLVTEETIDEHQYDLGLRQILGVEEEYKQRLLELIRICKDNTIYGFTDAFACNYTFLLLPGCATRSILFAGPFTRQEMTREQILAAAETHNTPAWLTKRLEAYYANVPVIEDTSVLLHLFCAFGEVIWGDAAAFTLETMQPKEVLPEILSIEAPPSVAIMDMDLMQSRYDYENELMDVVSRGQIHRAEAMIRVSQMNFEQRLPDSSRNLKNYAIICNTLLRKAAERGGVHPVYLDQISSGYAARIEQVVSVAAGQGLLSEMVVGYCRLVRKHASEKYSPPVRKAVFCIETDLSRDLSLRALAEELNVSAGYLSSLFHKETGKKVTEYVNDRRAERGAQLLKTTQLQIQTVAQYCGIPDVNYFTKVFKKYWGVTPREYRKDKQK